MQGSRIGIDARLGALDFDEALAKVKAALRAEGFGVLTEIDVQATLAEKLGVQHPPYRILGACNPPLAHQALVADPEVGLLLPCNVVVRQLPDGEILASFADPAALFTLIARPGMEPLVAEARDRIERAARAVAA